MILVNLVDNKINKENKINKINNCNFFSINKKIPQPKNPKQVKINNKFFSILNISGCEINKCLKLARNTLYKSLNIKSMLFVSREYEI